MIKTCQVSHPMPPGKTGVALSLLFSTLPIPCRARVSLSIRGRNRSIHFQILLFGKGLFSIKEAVLFIFKISKKQIPVILWTRGWEGAAKTQTRSREQEEGKGDKIGCGWILIHHYMGERFKEEGHYLLSSEASSRTRRRGRHTAESSFGEQQDKAVFP